MTLIVVFVNPPNPIRPRSNMTKTQKKNMEVLVSLEKAKRVGWFLPGTHYINDRDVF